MMVKKSILIKVLLAVVIGFIIFVGNLDALVSINGSGQGYDTENDGDKQLSTTGNYIEEYIVEAAGYFLQTHADILYFSNLYELSGDTVDIDRWCNVLNSANRNLQSTKSTYNRLIAAADATPYYQPVIDKLEGFDYRGFESERDLNQIVFGDVEVYLKNGNITGVYREVLKRLEAIETILARINTSVNNGMMPELSDVWQLNDVCSQKLMFGQYVAMVFANLDH